MLIYMNQTRYDGTRLYISDLFSPLKITIYPWDQNLEIEVIKPGFDPELDPQEEDFSLLDYDYGDKYDSDDNPVAEFLKCIPQGVRNKVRKFKYQQLQLLQLISLINDEDALRDENLLLLWLLQGRSSITGMNRKVQLSILAKGYESILGQLYDKPHLSIHDIRKVSGAEFGKPEFEGLEFVIETGAGFEILTHLDTIPIRLLRLMAKYPKMAGSKLLYSVFRSKQDYLDVIAEVDQLSKIWSECISIGEVLKIERSMNKLNGIGIQNILYKTRERWLRDIENLDEFPALPIDGTPVIIPIQRPIDLFSLLGPEHYLAPAYIDRVNQGKAYFYEARLPDTVMIQVDMESDGGLKLGDVWSNGDEGVKLQAREVIEEWIEDEIGR